jgi:manganese efflux pump family protein
MNLFEIVLIALGLSMDCFAASIALGINMKSQRTWHYLRISLAFAVSQGVMPLLGWLAGNTFSHLITEYDHWVAFGILLVLGLRMIYEHFQQQEDKKQINPNKKRVVFTLAFATSIDALAVGITFSFLTIDMTLATVVIALTTLLVSLIGLFLGHRSKSKLSIPAELIGGLFLIGIGIKILIEHLTA